MKFKKINLLAALTLLVVGSFYSLSTFAQTGSSRKASVSDFSAIKVSSSLDVYLTKGNKESLEIKGTQELIDKVEIKNEGNTLVLKMPDGFRWPNFNSNKSIKIYITYKTLNAITSSGSSDVYTENTLSTNSLKLRSSGSSDLKLTVDCTDLDVECSGSSDADLKGKTTNLTVRLSGSSDLKAYGLQSVNAKISCSGSSDAKINVSGSLEAAASGSSDIYYKGKATLTNKSASRSSDIKRVMD